MKRVRCAPLLAAAVVALMVGGASALFAQGVGNVVGTVFDAASAKGIPIADVVVEGTGFHKVTGQAGEYRITGVPVGSHSISARRLGYGKQTLQVTVVAGQETRVDFRLELAPSELDALVVTGTVGDTRRKAVGNAVSSLKVSDIVGLSSPANITEVMSSKVPGLTIVPGSGVAGTGAQFRLRGSGSINANANPTVYVDGIRMSGRDQGNYSVFGQTISSFESINPEDIESIEVIKGPAASTLYGAEAAAGVIQIITKKGRPGAIRWDARVETGYNDWDPALRPTNYAVATAAMIADTVNYPWYKGHQVGDIISNHLMTEPGALRKGNISTVSLSASGGGDRFSFFLSAAQDNQQGVNLNNYANRNTLRGNFAFEASKKLNIQTSLGYTGEHVRLPLNDNIAYGLIISSWLATPGRKYAYPGGLNYSTMIPSIGNTYDNQTRSDRFILGMSGEYKPLSWISNKFRVGLDVNVGKAELYFPPSPPGLVPWAPRTSFYIDNTKGFLAEGRPLTQDVTVNYDGTITRDLTTDLTLNSSVGMQYLSDNYQRTDAYGQDLGAAGIRSVSAAAVTTGNQAFSEQKSLGLYVQEQGVWRDRLFVTGAVRMDNNSAFGDKLNRVYYPKASVSYLISDESFFHLPAVNELRLRAAWGQAGNSPRPFDALRSYGVGVVTGSTTTSSALVYSAVGNPNLKPERGSELELGFELGTLNNRVRLDASYYDKVTRDALLPVAVAPSTGFSGSQLVNLGTISNTGVELLLTATALKRDWLTIGTTLSLSTNKNRLVSFGTDRDPIIFGDYAPTQRFQVGYPLGGFWAQRVKYDANGKLIRNAAGQPILEDSSRYMGPASPTRQSSFSTDFIFFKRLTLHGLLDYQGGNYQFNVKDWRRDRAGLSWATVNPAADPDYVKVLKFAPQTYEHIQKADFIKLRDLSVSYDVPVKYGVKRATITAAGHNLKIWTKYGGADPELNFNGGEGTSSVGSGGSTFNRNDSWTVPMLRRYSLSLTMGF